MLKTTGMVLLLFIAVPGFSRQYEGATMIQEHGYSDCIELSNDIVRVVLEPNVGGRVLVYERSDKNILYSDPEQDGWIWNPEDQLTALHPCGGRFDIGPEKVISKRPDLFLGPWQAEITGPRSARMISPESPGTGVQLIREFVLDARSSHLRCTQIIKNISEQDQKYCHWSRTFAKGGGICLAPLNPQSRFPEGFLIYGPPGDQIEFEDIDDPALRVRDGILEFLDTPHRPKFVMDAAKGWLAYISKDDQLFIKTFPVEPEAYYGDVAGNNVSVWYYKDKVVEIEPMSPWKTIPPGNCYSFTENWYLYDYT